MPYGPVISCDPCNLWIPWAPLAVRISIWPFVWLGLAVLALGAVLYVIRWIMMGGRGQSGPGLTIDEVEALRSRGLLTDEEYRRARRSALGLPDAASGEPAAKIDEPPPQE